MTVWLVADVGGTNARFALAVNGALRDDTIAHYRNDDFDGFASLLRAYLLTHDAKLSACCIAVAGQVSGPIAQLTNRPWTVSADEIHKQTGCDEIHLINDLYALGKALPHLQTRDLSTIRSAPPGYTGNGQSLIVNIGTGFNIAFVMQTGQNASSSRAEAGHSSLPLSVYKLLKDLIGARADQFPTAEHCFSGRGLSNVHAAAHDAPPRSGAKIVTEALSGNQTSAPAQFMRAYAQMLGTQLREMTLPLLPTSGLYFVGSVARGVFESPFKDDVITAFQVPVSPAMILPKIPMSVINSDNAGVLGCLAILKEINLNAPTSVGR